MCVSKNVAEYMAKLSRRKVRMVQVKGENVFVSKNVPELTEVILEKGEDGPSEKQKCGSKLTNVGNIDCGCVRNENEKGGKN